MGPALILAAVGSRPENLSVFDPASPSTESIRYLFILVLAITGVIALIVEGVLIYSLFKFHSRGASDTTEPPQVYGSLPIEIAWTAAPTLIVLILILVFVRTELEIRKDPANPPPGSQPLYVKVIGHQWWWEYVYESFDGETLGFTTANELHIPVSEEHVPRPVYLTLVSADVCHSYWVPRLSGKIDLIPGRTNQLSFLTEKPGTYLGQCAEYCGTQHANMLLRVVVEPLENFRSWLKNEQEPAFKDPSQTAGRDAFLAQSCINCHTVRGTRARGTFGPDLTHLMSRRTLASGMVPNSRLELRKWVVDPQEIKEGCNMPAMKLTTKDVDLVTDYLRTLK